MLRRKQASVRLGVVVSACAALLFLWKYTGPGNSKDDADHGTGGEAASESMPCWSLSGGNETLVVLRTGSTELQARLPVHLSTSFQCFAHHLVFSDLEEDFLGYRILDALETVSPDIIANNNDFALYRRLKLHGRAGLAASELSGSEVQAVRTLGLGRLENPGWRLDKWKFLPMLHRTFDKYPGMKWYVFYEPDAYIFWSTLQSYLSTLDHTRPLYAGDGMTLGDDFFAHGAAFVVSQPALRMVVEYYTTHKSQVESSLSTHWAGDCVLGRTFLDAGVPLTDAWPLMYRDHPGVIHYADERSTPEEDFPVWCQPTISYHHLSSDAVRDLWEFEQRWVQNRSVDSEFLRHRDIFKQYVVPQMMTPRMEWDNLSDHNESGVTSFEKCKATCDAQSSCRQYSYSETGGCKTRSSPRLGQKQAGVRSGWMENRVMNYEQGMLPCESETITKAFEPYA